MNGRLFRLAQYVVAAIALAGTPFEPRTVGAITQRTALSAGIAWFARCRVGSYRQLSITGEAT